jgi:hypothetical protein
VMESKIAFTIKDQKFATSFDAMFDWKERKKYRDAGYRIFALTLGPSTQRERLERKNTLLAQ